MSYRVQFLNDEEFNSLPGKDMEGKVGVAYPMEGVAYARKTGIQVVDAFTAIHELEHLKGNDLDEHFDSENECYYKGFGDVLRVVAPIALSFALPMFAPALGGALSGLGGGISSALGAVPGVGGALSGAAQSIGGALSSVGSAAGKVMGVGGQGGSATSAAADKSLLEASASPGNFASRMRSPSMPFGAGGSGPNVAAMGAAGAGNAFGSAAKEAGGSFATQGAQSIFGGDGESPLEGFQMNPSEGSFEPFTSSSPNVVAGASGSGSQGGAGGAPGSIGGGSVSKIKQYLSNRDEGGNQGIGLGGNF